MWKIAVCDDDVFLQDTVERLLNVYAAQPFQLQAFQRGEDLLQAQLTALFDLIYLDIQMPGLNGLDTAKALRQQGCTAAIIFLTNYDDYLEAGYEVQAFRYRFKPLDEMLFQKDLLDWQVWQRGQGGRTLAILAEDGVHQVLLRDIICVEVAGRKVQITTTDGLLHSVVPMQQWEQQLVPEGFLCPYYKILVNPIHVKFFDQTTCLLTGDLSLPMSRRKYHSFFQAMLEQ